MFSWLRLISPVEDYLRMTHALHNFHFHEHNVPTEHRNGKALPEGLAAIFSAVVLTRGNMPKVLLEPQFGPIQANSSFLALLFIKQDPAPRMRRKSRVGIRLIHDASVPLCLDNGNPTGCVFSHGRQTKFFRAWYVLGCLVWSLNRHPLLSHRSSDECQRNPFGFDVLALRFVISVVPRPQPLYQFFYLLYMYADPVHSKDVGICTVYSVLRTVSCCAVGRTRTHLHTSTHLQCSADTQIKKKNQLKGRRTKKEENICSKDAERSTLISYPESLLAAYRGAHQ